MLIVDNGYIVCEGNIVPISTFFPSNISNLKEI